MRRSLVIVAFIAGAVSLRAQDAPAPSPAIQRIWTLGMDSSHAPRLAQVLLDSLGPRLLGSPDMEAAQRWAMNVLGGYGIEASKENFGTWRGWRRGHSHIDLIAPRVRTLEGTMLGFSPGTRKKNKVAETVILPLFKDSTEAQVAPDRTTTAKDEGRDGAPFVLRGGSRNYVSTNACMPVG